MKVHRYDVELMLEELDLELSVTSGQTFRWRKLEDGSWAGVDGDTWWAAEVPRLIVASNKPRSAFTSYFRLDQSLTDIRSQIKAMAPEIAPCLDQIKGLRVLSQSVPEEVFFTFLCTPNNNVERIARMVRTLETYGEPLEAPFEAWRFPGAERICRIPEQELRARAFGYRGKSIPNAARELLERGPDWLSGLKQVNYPEAHAELCRITGIGPKLADCICLFGLGFTEAVPVDTHLWQSACRTYFPEWAGKSLTDLRYREIGDLFREKFGKLAGWAHQYMFYENLLRWRSRRAAT